MIPGVAGSSPVGLPSPSAEGWAIESLSPTLLEQRIMGHTATPADLRIVLVQHDIAWENKPSNHAAYEQLVRGAAQPGSFVILPELCDVGFTMNTDAAASPGSLEWAQALARSHQVWLQAGLAESVEGGVANAAFVIRPDGDVAAVYRKIFLFSHGTEPQHYCPGDGPVLVDVAGWTVAPFICYDLRFPEVWRVAALAGAELFTLGANWPARRHEHWRTLVRARAIENQAFVACCNRVGRDPSLEYAGGSALIDPRGGSVAEASDAACATVVTARRDEFASWRAQFAALGDAQRRWLGG